MAEIGHKQTHRLMCEVHSTFLPPITILGSLPLLVVTKFYISGRNLYDRALEMAFLHLPTAAPIAADDAYRHLIKTGL